MPFLTHTFDTPGDNTYNSTEIEIASGQATLLPDFTKVLALYQLNGPGNIATDDTGNFPMTYNGATALWVPGRVGNAWSPEGGNYFLAADNTVFSNEYTVPWSRSFWFRKTNDGQARFIYVKKLGSGTYRGEGIMVNFTGRLQVFMTNISSKEISIQTSNQFYDGLWHFATICYDGSGAAAGVTFNVDHIPRTPQVVADTLDGNSIISTATASIGGSSGTLPWADLLDQFIIWNTCIDQDIIDYMWNEGNGRAIIPRHVSPIPKLYKTAGYDTPPGEHVRWTGYSVTPGAGNEGTIGGRVSDDGDTTWKVYDGDDWVPNGEFYNPIAVINANIKTLNEPPMPPTLHIQTVFISENGFQKVELISETVQYTQGLSPILIMGPGETTNDNETILPFEPTTFTDPDGNVIKAEWRSVEVLQENTAPQDGTDTTIYLSSDASEVNDFYNGKLIFFEEDFYLITDYVGATRMVTISGTFPRATLLGDFYSVSEPVENDWEEIPQGDWATLQDAVQAFQHAFRTNGPVFTPLRAYLRVTDDDVVPNSTTDSKTIAVHPYTITLRILSPQQQPLDDVTFTPGDSRPPVVVNDGNTIVYKYGDYIVKLQKDSYIDLTQELQVRVSKSEYFQLNQNLTLDNLDQIWLVLLSTVLDEGTTGAALYSMLQILTSIPYRQVPKAIAGATWLNAFKQCSQFRIGETPFIVIATDEDLTGVTGLELQLIKPDGSDYQWEDVNAAGSAVTYRVNEGELDQVGQWKIRPFADDLDGFKGSTNWITFTVLDDDE